jgi:hypothetical protein
MYTTNYFQNPDQARLNALFLQLCSNGGNGGGSTVVLKDNCFVTLDSMGKEVAKLCLTGWGFPAQNANLLNLDLLPGDSALLFDNQLTNYIATPIPSNKAYVRGVLIKVTYPSLDANGQTVDPSLYTCKLTLSNLQDLQLPPFVSAGAAIGIYAEDSPLTPATPLLAGTINLEPQVAATGGATIVKYQWTKQVAPTGDISSIYTPNSATTKVTNLIPGVYIFKLTLTDSNNVTAFSTVPVVVYEPTDTPPTISIDPSQTITLADAQDGISINAFAQGQGSATIVNQLWSQIGGPTTVTFNPPNAGLTGVTGMTLPGIYTFLNSAIDSDGFITNATMTVTVTDLQTFSMPLNTFYAHFWNPVTTDATQLMNSMSITNISAVMPICVQALLITNASQPTQPGSNPANNNCNC